MKEKKSLKYTLLALCPSLTVEIILKDFGIKSSLCHSPTLQLTLCKKCGFVDQSKSLQDGQNERMNR